MNILIVNGPNLNLLGTREPHIYGADTLPDLERRWRRHGARLGVGVRTFQSNHEGAIIDHLHAQGPRSDGVIINAGALSHTSYAIHDAIVAIDRPTVEVHISNIHEREAWRATSVTSPAADVTILGRGPVGYLNAIDHLWAASTSPPIEMPYGDLADQRIDLRIPAAPEGVVVLLHGGFWRPVWARDIMDPLAVRLTERGWATANVGYRRGDASFPAATADVAAALDTVRTEIAARGLSDLPVVVVGHSAGGYLAIRETARRSDGTRAVGLAPVIDLAGISSLRPDDDPVARFLGAGLTDDPETWTEASIAQHAPERLVIVHGAADESVPVAGSETYAARHPSVVLNALPEVGHMSLIDPTQECVAQVTAAIADSLA